MRTFGLARRAGVGQPKHTRALASVSYSAAERERQVSNKAIASGSARSRPIAVLRGFLID
jgi:hypothetical protein